ncbi:MAG: type II toxin-antitoxin system Phd/YefM family antitoxin [Ilumatobacteraceae bacterium]
MTGIRELRADLAALVRRAGAGQRVVITIGGRPVAQLGPVEAGPAAPTLHDLFATGAVMPPRRRSAAHLGEPLPVWAGTRLDRALRDVRG